MVIMIIPWLVTKMKSMINDTYGHYDYHGHHDLPLDHKKDEDYDEYGHHDHPKVYNKDEDHPGNHNQNEDHDETGHPSRLSLSS